MEELNSPTELSREQRRELDKLIPLFNFFAERCVNECERRVEPFNEESLHQFIGQIGTDDILQTYFIFTYMNLIPQQGSLQSRNKFNNIGNHWEKLVKRIYDFRTKFGDSVYLDLFEDDLRNVWLTARKMEAGDERDFSTIYTETLPQNYEIQLSETRTLYLELHRQNPILSDSVVRHKRFFISEDEKKWINGVHYFGVDLDDRKHIENFMHKFMRDRLSRRHQVLPSDRMQNEYFLHFHADSIPSDLIYPNVSWKKLNALCEKTEEDLPLAWGPKFFPLILTQVSKARKMAAAEGISDKYGKAPTRSRGISPFVSRYPDRYWVFVEYPDEIQNITTFHFLESTKALHKCDSEEKIPGYLKAVFENKRKKWFERETEKAKKLEERRGKEPPFYGSLYYYNEDDKSPLEEKYSGELIPSTKPIDLDELFTDPIQNYLAKKFNKKGVVKDAAAKFGLTKRRIQQIKKEVGQKLDGEEEERLAYLSVWYPGIDDDDVFRGELTRIASLRYRKPYYKWHDIYEEGEDTNDDTKTGGERRDYLSKKYPQFEKRLKKM
jgi:hypothetical protein